jgi:hypothetical protein
MGEREKGRRGEKALKQEALDLPVQGFFVGAGLVHISTSGSAMPPYFGVIHMFTWLSTGVDKVCDGDIYVVFTTN